MPRGGHFAALEEPELLAQDIREFFRPLRGWGRSSRGPSSGLAIGRTSIPSTLPAGAPAASRRQRATCSSARAPPANSQSASTAPKRPPTALASEASTLRPPTASRIPAVIRPQRIGSKPKRSARRDCSAGASRERSGSSIWKRSEASRSAASGSGDGDADGVAALGRDPLQRLPRLPGEDHRQRAHRLTHRERAGEAQRRLREEVERDGRGRGEPRRESLRPPPTPPRNRRRRRGSRRGRGEPRTRPSSRRRERRSPPPSASARAPAAARRGARAGSTADARGRSRAGRGARPPGRPRSRRRTLHPPDRMALLPGREAVADPRPTPGSRRGPRRSRRPTRPPSPGARPG